jgi:hypothetical protein
MLVICRLVLCNAYFRAMSLNRHRHNTPYLGSRNTVDITAKFFCVKLTLRNSGYSFDLYLA